MREEFGDLWTFYSHPNSIACITTNGFVKSNGQCVMGRGCAYQAKQRFPEIAERLGTLIQRLGNHVHELGYRCLSFPTKHVWWEKSDLELIKRSVGELKEYALEHPDLTYYLPRPGCSNGGLTWGQVQPILDSVDLPTNIVAITYGPPS